MTHGKRKKRIVRSPIIPFALAVRIHLRESHTLRRTFMKHLHAAARIGLVLAAMLFAALPSTASPIGFIAFDAGQGQTGDQYAFNVTNLSGGFAIFPEFQILDPIAFTDWSLRLDDGTIVV